MHKFLATRFLLLNVTPHAQELASPAQAARATARCQSAIQPSLTVPTFIALMSVTFVAIRLVPGDPVEVREGERGINPEWLAMFRQELGLDQPIFWWGLLLIMFVAERWGLSPVSGRIDLIKYCFEPVTGLMVVDAWLSGQAGAVRDALHHRVLPAIVLGTIPLAVIARMTRSAMLEVRSEDSVRTARAQVLNLRVDLQQAMGVAYVFISHDLGVVRHGADQVMVMDRGRVVEQGPREAIFGNPQHPYPQALLSATPTVDPALRRQRIILQGELSSPINPPSGCAFHTRCPIMLDRCHRQAPQLLPLASADHACSNQRVACLAVLTLGG